MNQSQAGAYGRDTDAAPGALRPLADMPEAARGGMPPARIARLLGDLVAELTPLHAGWRVHGAISPRTVGLDASGRAHLMAGPASPAADAESFERTPGYAAFEQYTDDPQHPCGPWTDVYALSALAYALATGEPPVPALLRCVRDEQAPLSQRLAEPSAAAFAQAIDAGLSMDHRVRPASLDALAQRLAAATRAAGTEEGMAAAAKPPGLPASAPVPVPAPAALPTPPAAFVPPPAPALVPVSVGIPAPVSGVPAAPIAAPAPIPASAPLAMPEPILAPAAETFPEPIPEPAPIVAAAPLRPRRDDDEESKEVDPEPAARSAKPARVSIPMVLLVLVVIGCAVFFWMRMQGGEAPIVAGNGGTPAGSSSGAFPAGPSAGRPETPTPPQPPSQPQAAVPPPPSTAAPSAPASSVPPSDSVPPEPPPLVSATPTVPAGGLGSAASQAPPPVSTAAPGATGGVPPMPGASATDGTSASGPGPFAGQPGTGASAAGGVPGTVKPSTSTATGSGTDLPPAATASTEALAAAAAEVPPKPAAATVNLNIRPWGEVLVDGKSRGVSPPLRQLTLSPGKHTITVRNPASSDYQVSVDLSDGRGTSVSHTFE